MADCQKVEAELAGLVDAALDDSSRQVVESHLAACPACRRIEARQRAAQHILRARAANLRLDAAPPGLRSRCEVALQGEVRGRRRWGGWLVPAGVIAVLVLSTATALFAVATERSDALLAAQLTADHLKCFRFFGSGSAVSADAPKVEAMLRAKYGWSIHIPPSAVVEGLRLDGARRCLYAEGTIPHIMYQAHGQNVSLFVLDGQARLPAEITALGHHTQIWSRGRTTYVMVSSAQATDLAGVVSYVQHETH